MTYQRGDDDEHFFDKIAWINTTEPCCANVTLRTETIKTLTMLDGV